MEDPRLIARFAQKEAKQRFAVIMSAAAFIGWPELREFIRINPINSLPIGQEACKQALSTGYSRRKRGEVIVCNPTSTIGDSPFDSSITFRNRQIKGF